MSVDNPDDRALATKLFPRRSVDEEIRIVNHTSGVVKKFLTKLLEVNKESRIWFGAVVS